MAEFAASGATAVDREKTVEVPPVEMNRVDMPGIVGSRLPEWSRR
jgi:hypothetical protein